MKKFLRFLFPCLTLSFEVLLLFVTKDTIEFYGLLFGFTVCMFVSAYLWRKELF